jgi:hypothetical protein
VAALDDLLPRWDFRERHARVVAAPADAVYAAVRDVTVAEMPLARGLLAARGIVGHGLPRPDRPLLDVMRALGFATLVDTPPSELAIGGIGPMWRPGARLHRIADVDDFRRADRPGTVKVALGFVLGAAAGVTQLATETRVLAADAAAWRKFAAYWLLIRAPSGAVRHSMLGAIARRAAAA